MHTPHHRRTARTRALTPMAAVTVIVTRVAVLVPAQVSLAQSPPEADQTRSEPPDRPTGLTGTLTHDSVSLTWDDPEDSTITGYQILRLDRAIHDPGNFVVHVDDTGVADNSYTDADVSAGASYVYRIKARNDAGRSRRSIHFNARLPETPAALAQAPSEPDQAPSAPDQTPPEADPPTDTSTDEGEDDLTADHTTTGVVVVGGSVTGTVDSASDIDWWAIPADVHGHILFDLEGADTGRGSLEDPWIYGIFSARNSNPWLSSGGGDAGVGRNSQTYREFVRHSRYSFFVAVRGYGRGTNTGTYTLTVTDITNIEDDYAADTTTTGTVQVGSSVRGLIRTPADRDWFGVVLTAARTYRFDLGGETNRGGTLFDPHLFGIHDDGGTLIDGTADADSGIYYNSRVLFTPTSTGTHYVAAGFLPKGSALDPGTYTLAVTDVTDIPDSHSADTGTSGTIELDTPATGEIDYEGDSDWFKVTLEAGTPYQVDVQGADTDDGTLPDPHLQGIHNADGAKLSNTTDYNRGAGRNARTVYRPPASGTYYVAVAGFQSVGQTTAGRHREQLGTYTVTVADVTDGVPADTTTAATVTVGASMTGTVDYRGDVDWVAVSLTAGEVYRIELDGISLPDPKIHGVRNADGDRLAGTTDDDSGRGDNSRVDFTPASTGTYYVTAGGSPNATGIYTAPTGTYRLTVSDITVGVADDYAADTSTTGVVEIGGSLRGRFETPDDEDWFAMTLAAGTTYEINVGGKYAGGSFDALGNLLDPDIAGLYRHDGTLIANTAVSTNWWNFGERLVFSPDASGPYYLATKAGDAGDPEGTYTVSVNEQQ